MTQGHHSAFGRSCRWRAARPGGQTPFRTPPQQIFTISGSVRSYPRVRYPSDDSEPVRDGCLRPPNAARSDQQRKASDPHQRRCIEASCPASSPSATARHPKAQAIVFPCQDHRRLPDTDCHRATVASAYRTAFPHHNPGCCPVSAKTDQSDP